MFKSFLGIFGGQGGEDAKQTKDHRRAMAALLAHIGRSDGDFSEIERVQARRILAESFELTAQDAEKELAAAEAEEREASDIQRYTRALTDALDEEQREAFLEHAWTIVLAEGGRDIDENALMRQLAALLYVPDQKSNLARRRAERRLEAKNG